MKKLLCKWFDLVPRSEMELRVEEVRLTRDLFIKNMLVDLDKSTTRILQTGQSMQNETFPGVVYVAGDQVVIRHCRVKGIKALPSVAQCFFNDVHASENWREYDVQIGRFRGFYDK